MPVLQRWGSCLLTLLALGCAEGPAGTSGEGETDAIVGARDASNGQGGSGGQGGAGGQGGGGAAGGMGGGGGQGGDGGAGGIGGDGGSGGEGGAAGAGGEGGEGGTAGEGGSGGEGGTAGEGGAGGFGGVGGEGGAGGGEPPGPCDLGALAVDDDAPRYAVIAYPFGAVAGEHGTAVASHPMDGDGHVLAEIDRIDVGGRPARVRFVPSGMFALVLTEDGILSSLRVDEAGALTLQDTIALPGVGWDDLVIDPEGRFAYAVRTDVTEEAGLFTITIECGGVLTALPEHFGMRLAQAFTLFPDDPNRGILLGGQTVFEPVVAEDTRILARKPNGVWEEVIAFDLWGDFYDSFSIGISPDGRSLLVPNGSPFSEEGGQVMHVSIDDSTTLSLDARILEMEDARGVFFAPNGTALVTRLEPGRITVMVDEGQGFEAVDEVRLGLPEDLAILTRGALAGMVVVPSVSGATGPQIATLKVGTPGEVTVVNITPLGEDSTLIPTSVGVRP